MTSDWSTTYVLEGLLSEAVYLVCVIVDPLPTTIFPPVIAGIAGMLATIAYGVYGYRNRGPMSTSKYLLKFRVLAQGAVVAAMIVGATISTRKPKQ